MAGPIHFIVTYNLQLDDFLDLADDDVTKELMHSIYMLSDVVPNRLAELQRLAVRVKELQDDGFKPDESSDEDRCKEILRSLDKAIDQYSDALQQNSVDQNHLSDCDRDRLVLMWNLLDSIEYDEDLEDLAFALEDIIDRLKEDISPF